ncbi:hypothetical protein UVI_02018330 [Ustilaginoidea virens]|uniref:Xylanolytic transcriptional activator regulatory domain-containing protein n=1 Tax=Ustilaginoidea virens TaxID=1159556 RepID=A0A1B5KUR8_USTVR|nr:hypothetical protein UVI_02018330 [Ustilaginoidea virens]
MSTAKATKKSAFSCEPCRRRKATGRDTDDQGVSRSFRTLKVDDKGSITYHGATSFFNLPSERNGFGLSDVYFLHTPSIDTDSQRRERLISNAWHQRAMENLSEIPEPFQYLLNVHWCWIQPLFNFIYRPVFTRDMQCMGPYYSHTLLNAVISHSIRWGRSDASTRRLLDESYQGGAVFGKHARNMLFQELSSGVCTIPTIQTLLLLSAQECSLGNSTQAWTYSGIAFRLIDHLGICVDSQRFPGSVPLSDEELEIRRRIYWGCFFWDKLICLYLGRSPSLQHTDISPSQVMFDDSAEDDVWVPFGTPQTDPSWKYPPTTAHSASCFMSMCRLSLIFNEILVHMYDPLSQNTDTEIQECLESQEPLLRQWWHQLPVHLKIDAAALPALAPPSHIVTLKFASTEQGMLRSRTSCLYHVFKILLYRPTLTGRGQRGNDDTSPVERYLVESVTSATSIMAIFDLFCRTFTMQYCVLSLAYCVYIASSIFLLQVQAAPGDHQAMRKLTYCIQCLQQVRQISPVLTEGLDALVIECALKNIGKELTEVGIPFGGNSPQSPPQPRKSPTAAESSVPRSGPAYQPSPETSASEPNISHPGYQPSFNQYFGPDAMSMGPGVFETMSTLEPLSIRVGAIPEPELPPIYG